MNIDELLGKTTQHLVPLEGTKFLVHKNIKNSFLKLQHDAKKDGFNLQIISAFRDYERQLKIWNQKASGERVLIDDQERPLDFNSLSPIEVMFAILRWSALPGSSRHHWGTDIDVYDGNTQSASEVQLIPSETVERGASAKLHEWLDYKIKTNSSYGFYRPYEIDRGGISPERWHLSCSSVANQYMKYFTLSLFKKNIQDSEIILKEVLLSHADEIYQRFLQNIDLS